MPPVMDRTSSRKRAAQGWELRVKGRTWNEIAQTLGYGTHAAAYNAVTKWIKQNPPDELAVMRRATGHRLMSITNDLLDSLAEAKESGDHAAVATLGRAAIDAIDRYAKLTGQHIPVEVNVNVTATQALSDTRARLLEAIDAATAEPAAITAQAPLDAEIVEVVE
jgi:hypothetical protein